ncbi:hypothetical protein KC318_g2491 [Hortaea werneckii]|nr:hypothetical protein KC334_g2937 [Hortaea werneckii]KAI7025072.1 hypothetical protein KC355_g1188 [Hortaea werneckii]KAI7172969.1 hypothetical protein KC324_g10605 [Hortaea werneckii]KAI7546692.1 hypothetical protein KC316_g14740 [Hortaea werneckii]KAI7672972.1 hypothetical protein KC318_g2491 [Hortaea werneckii]
MASSRRPTQSNQQGQQGQDQKQSTSSSWFLNSSTGLYYYYNAQTDEFIYQNGTRVPRPSSIPRAGLLEQHREAGSNNSQQTTLSDLANGRNYRRNYTYAAETQFDNPSPGGQTLPTGPRNRQPYVQSGHHENDGIDDEQEEDSSAEDGDDDDDDEEEEDQVTEQQIHALTQRGYTPQEALRFLHLTLQQGYSREQAVILIQYLRQGYTFAQAVMALQQSQQGPQGQQQQQR